MKALFAVILLASSTVFAQATTAPVATPTPEEQAANILVVSCAIEKFCAAGTQTALDSQFALVKPEAEKLLNMTCTDIDAIWANPDAITAIKDFSAAVTTAGETTCLSVVQ